VDTALFSDDLAALYAAKDLLELMALTHVLDRKDSIWALLRPTDGSGQILLSGDAHVRLDPLPAGLISGIGFPVGSALFPASASWAINLLRYLAYQNDWTAETESLLPVWGGGVLVAIVGASRSTALLRTVGLALRQLHQVGESQRDVEGARYLLKRADKAVLLANRVGKILFGTAGGYIALKRMTHRTDLLPPILRTAIDQSLKQVLHDGCQINLSELALVEPTMVESLISVRFARKTPGGNVKLDLSAALETLTPAERKVYPLLIEGLRTKEIADQLGCSFHTAKHHCAHIVEKCGVPDRLALIAKAHPLPEPRKPNNPAVPPLPVVEALPLQVVRRKTSEPV
jgi:DNA-binding CsgD family transcriptional regulator